MTDRLVLGAQPVRGTVFAVMTVDPGGVSGVATGEYVAYRTAGETMREAVYSEDVTAYEVVGDYWDQADEIAEDWCAFRRRLRKRSIAPVLVIESFQLRQRHVDLAPVEVASGLVSLLQDEMEVCVAPSRTEHMMWQTPGDAHAVTSQRLKDFGVYAIGRGSEHKRDALRHQVVYINAYLP